MHFPPRNQEHPQGIVFFAITGEAKMLPHIQSSLAEYMAQLADVETQFDKLAPAFFYRRDYRSCDPTHVSKSFIDLFTSPTSSPVSGFDASFFEWLDVPYV